MGCTAHTNTTACTAHTATTTCATHVTGPCVHAETTTCVAHVELGSSAPPGTATVWTDDPLTTSIKIKQEHHNELRAAINTELLSQGKTWPIDPGYVSRGINKVLYTHVRQLRDGIDEAQAWSYPSYLSDSYTEVGDKVLKDQYTALRSQVNSIETGCPCDCNYGCTCQCNYACTCQCNYACTCQCNYACTCDCNFTVCSCDCNYCTCNCNYCTCDCNYCTCDCNYICTCNCAYSDKRLKTEIIYM